MVCQECKNETERLCTVFVLVPGRDAQGVHNTQDIGKLCNACVVKLINHEITLEMPDDALGTKYDS